MLREVPTCGAGERVRDVRGRLGEWESCFVVDSDGVVIGRLGRSALRSEEDVSAGEAMTEGPGTIRPSARLAWALERMRSRNLTGLPVTTSDGKLVGLLRLEDAERALRSGTEHADG
jgi:Mg/Co/Ni transporter MgtE